MENISDINIVQLGTIGFLNYELEEDEKNLKKKSDNKCEQKIKLNFDGENELLCLNSQNKNKEYLTILKDKAIYYCLYLRSNDQERGYYYDEKNHDIIIIEKLDENSYLAYYSKLTKDQEEIDITEYHFSGESATRIEENYESIKKEYIKDNTKIIIAVFAIATLVLLYMGYELLFDEKPPPPPPPPKVHKQMSRKTIAQLKSYASVDGIKKIRSLIDEITSDELLNNGKQRVIVLKQNKVEVLLPEMPISRGGGNYYYKNPKMIDGGLAVSYDKTYQIIYPKSGYIYSGKGIYVKEEKSSYQYVPSLVKNASVKLLTKECISNALNIAPKDTFVYERSDSLITFKFKNLPASSFLDKAEKIIKECPAYLEEISVSGGKFQGNLILYAQERLR